MAGYMNTAKNTCWETPRELFDRLDRIWRFDLDAASSDANALCADHFTEEDDGLAQSWAGRRVWLNPPYGRGLDRWVRKAHEEAQRGAIVVALLPARTDTRWFHEYVAGGGLRRVLTSTRPAEVRPRWSAAAGGPVPVHVGSMGRPA